MNVRRLIHVAAVFAVLVTALVARLAQLQILQHSEWVEEARRSRTEKRSIPYNRGTIFDARGKVLAEDRQAFDLHLVYRDFRRGHPGRAIPGHVSAQLFEAYLLLSVERRAEAFHAADVRYGGVEECFAGGPLLADRLLRVSPAELGHLGTSGRGDLRFYLRGLFGLDADALESWMQPGAPPLGEAFPEARPAFLERYAAASDALAKLEELLAYEPGELLARVEHLRLLLERRLRVRAALQAAGTGFSLSVSQLWDCLDGRVETRDGILTREEFLARLHERWRIAEAGFSVDELENLLRFGQRQPDGDPPVRDSLREVGRLLQQVERAAPKDLAGTRRSLSRDLHARDRILKPEVDFEVLDLILMNPTAYPGLTVVEKPRRIYPDDTALALVGRAGENEDQALVERQRAERDRYRQLAHNLHRTAQEDEEYRQLRERVRREHVWAGEVLGRSGVELHFDDALRGKRGFLDQLQSDSDPEEAVELDFISPQHGRPVRLALDTELVHAAERAMQAGYREAARLVLEDPDLDPRAIPGLARPRAGLVLLDLRDASVPVLATWPRYTDEEYRKHYSELVEDPERPLFHRCLGFNFGGPERTPYPGSTFKPLVAYVALEQDQTAWEREYLCEGRYEGLHCDARYGHGMIDMHTALMKSCNVYFYRLGEELGYGPVYRAAQGLGFGDPTGVLGGNMEYAYLRHPREVNRRQLAGAARHLSIGQAYVAASPLQMARFYGWLATGRLLTPRLALEVGGRPTPVEAREVALPARVRDLLQGALSDVVADVGGTAHGDGLEEFGVAGKTGTAQVSQSGPGTVSNVHSWFAGWFPREEPRWAVAVYCENTGLHGGDCATLVLAEFLRSPEFRAFEAPL